MIIHKYILKEWNRDKTGLVGYNYLCNCAVEANWLKTDITNKKVTCKNCKQAIKKFNKKHTGKNIIEIKLIEGYL